MTAAEPGYPRAPDTTSLPEVDPSEYTDADGYNTLLSGSFGTDVDPEVRKAINDSLAASYEEEAEDEKTREPRGLPG